MNNLSASLDISKETVKKAYSILRNLGFVEARQGKGYYVSPNSANSILKVLVLFDKLSTYKQILFNSFLDKIGNSAEITIRLHSQNVDLLEYYLDENLDMYDFYVITPHFPLDAITQKKVLKLLKRIPNRKLILVDKKIDELPGNYGAVYQDFSNDIYDGLKQGLKTFKNYSRLNVVTLPSSLYAQAIKSGVEKFCNDFSIPVEYHSTITPEMIRRNEAYLILNSQLDFDLIRLVLLARERKFKFGKDIGIISYNESPINQIILNGLTSVSTDFCQMGELVADMILNRKLAKVKCDFHMIRRSTF
jgi:DNA-binding LacI/PurR family transcriptional regulator